MGMEEFITGRTDSSVSHLIGKDKASESISKTKNVKIAGPTSLMSEMVQSAGEAKLYHI